MTSEQRSLNERIESYLSKRVEQYQSWYDGKAVKMKKYYLRSRIVSAVGAVLIPIISNTDFLLHFTEPPLDITRILVTTIGLIVAILIALEGVLVKNVQVELIRPPVLV